ncbi:MAG TPA: glycoside hydrolase family 36 protein [Verrucomicrobiae bacterium]|nr:glycoside hydrolase family 36 protein [Verrucomicrobiae bacterium]
MRKAIGFWLASLLATFGYGAQSTFDPQRNTWTLTNGSLKAVFQLTGAGNFLVQDVSNVTSGDHWYASADHPSSPVLLTAGNEVFDAQRQYTLLNQWTEATTPSGVRQLIALQDMKGVAQATVALELYDNQPVLRYHVRWRNRLSTTMYVTSVDLLPWTFSDSGETYTAMNVNQWSVAPVPKNFETMQQALPMDGTPFTVYSGAHGDQCSWLALRGSDGRGLFAGWEFDGRAQGSVAQNVPGGGLGYVQFSASILELNHPVDPAADFETPSAFLGVFHGNFDEAGYRTQALVDAVLAAPVADAQNFPYVSWDSWGYQTAVDEVTLRANADIAASLGVELFVVDLGWAQGIGNWYADPQKFPSGMAALADYVHSLGMKFGLHFPLAEADPSSPVLQANPDWTSTENDGYFGAASLCLSNRPTKEWLIQQALHIIDDYHIDWILQDGENMVKQCTKSTHTHDPADSNYSNSVEGIDAVVEAVEAARPNVLWENCEDGGNMMTFSMVKHYATSITNDASGDFPARQAVYGATYPFPPRFAERYMPPTDGVGPYATHSYRFGGNWAIMDQLPTLSVDQLGFLKQQIADYKQERADIAGGKVYHLAAPAANGADAIQSYNPTTDIGLAVVSRAQSPGTSYLLRPQGLNGSSHYTVYFEIDPTVYSMSGTQLMNDGVRVSLPTPDSSEVVHMVHQ